MPSKLPKLQAFLAAMPAEDREVFAADAGTTYGHLRNVAYGYRPCAPILAVAIELLSSGRLRRWDLLPDEWAATWPELVGAEGAPAPPAAPIHRVRAAA